MTDEPLQPEQQFDNPALGRALRKAAIKRVRQHADPAWLAAAFSAVERAAREQPRFATDDAKRIMEPGYSTHEPRAWGAVMTKAQRELVCRPEPAHKLSQRGISHMRPQRIWHSLIYWRTLTGRLK